MSQLWIEFLYESLTLAGGRVLIGYCRGCRRQVTEGERIGADRRCEHGEHCPHKERGNDGAE